MRHGEGGPVVRSCVSVVSAEEKIDWDWDVADVEDYNDYREDQEILHAF